MQFNSYFLRALKTADKRYARVFEKMGYCRRDMRAVEDNIAEAKVTPNEAREVIGLDPIEATEIYTALDVDADDGAPKKRGRKPRKSDEEERD